MFEQSAGLYQSSSMQLNLGYALYNQAGLAWHLGDYQAARALRNQTAAVVQGLDSNDSQFVSTVMIPLLDAQIALSELEFDVAKSKSQQSLNLLNESRPEEIVAAKYTSCLALVMSGTPRASTTNCNEAVALARNTKDDRLTAEALLALSQALVEQGKWQKALDVTQQALPVFSKLSKFEAEWRTWLLAARANQGRKAFLQAHEAALRAEEKLKTLRHGWGEQAYRQYLNRKDIQQLLRQLNDLLTVSK
jgi:tetratricopeptide (TPR) repeat protein